MTDAEPLGIVAMLVDRDGREIATASDFKREAPGGYTLRQGQQYRAKMALCGAVMRALASPRLSDAIDNYTAERIVEGMQKQGCRIIIIPIGHKE